jgi:protocatechuate 3,4-dioxygenase beta subunit
MLKKVLIAATIAAVAIPAIAFKLDSGLAVGESVTPFHPKHLSGPDKGTDTCPPCKYGSRPAVQIWANGETAENIAAFAKLLSAEVADSKADLKAFIINLAPNESAEHSATKMATGAPANIGFAMLPSTDQAVKNYKVNTSNDVKNTVFVYRNKKVVAKFVNLKADKAGLGQLVAAIDRAEQ